MTITHLAKKIHQQFHVTTGAKQSFIELRLPSEDFVVNKNLILK